MTCDRPALGGGGPLGGTVCPEALDVRMDSGQFADTGTFDNELLGGPGDGCSHVGPGSSWLFWLVLAKILVGQAFGADIDRLDPVDSGTFFGVHESDVGERRTLRAAVWVAHAHRPITLTVPATVRNPDGRVGWMLGLSRLQASASYTVLRGLRVGASIPMENASYESRQLAIETPKSGTYLSSATGWATVQTQAMSLRLAFERPIDEAPFLSSARWIVGASNRYEYGRWTIGWHADLRIENPGSQEGVPYGSEVTGAMGLARDLGDQGTMTLELTSGAPLRVPTGFHDFPTELLFTHRIPLTEALTFRAGGSAGITRTVGTPIARLFAQLQLQTHPPRDDDSDQIVNWRDRCRFEPEDFDGFRDADGCPDPDNDQDGFVDIEDACPLHPEVYNDIQDDDGCPDAPARWTVKAAGTEEFKVTHAGEETRLLGDESWTRDFEPGSHRVHLSAPGMQPITVVEVLPESQHITTTVTFRPKPPPPPPPVPVETHVEVEGKRVVLDDATFFELDKHSLSPLAEAGLDALAAWLRDHPEVLVLRVEGHADSIGGSAYNLQLSEHRANTVLEALVDRGIDRERLRAVGSGESIAWNGPVRAVGFTILVHADY